MGRLGTKKQRNACVLPKYNTTMPQGLQEFFEKSALFQPLPVYGGNAYLFPALVHKKTKPDKRTGFVLNEYNQMEMELATSISLGSMVLCMDSATLTS